jgi:glutaredoxin
MEFPKPIEQDIFTIYSKTNCSFCQKIKSLIEILNLNYHEINCDEYLLEPHRTHFFKFIEDIMGKELKSFPIVFIKGKHIGGYKETEKYLSFIDTNF